MNVIDKKTERKVTIDYAWCEAESNSCDSSIRVQLHDSWDARRKKQPVVVMNMEHWQAIDLLSVLSRAVRESRDAMNENMEEVKRELG